MLSTVDSNSGLAALVHHIVLSYFVAENYCTAVYYDRNLVDDTRECDQYCAFLRVTETVLASKILEEHPVMWISVDDDTGSEHVENAIEHGCQSYIVISHNVLQFLELKLLLKETSNQRIRDRNFLIFSDAIPQLDDEWVTREAFLFYPNLWFMIASYDIDIYDFYTQDYSLIDVNELQLVDSFNASSGRFTGNGIIFNDKLFDLRGRTVRMAVLDYIPYCVTKNVGVNRGNADAYNSSLPKELFLEGLEGDLIVEFCRHRNCNIQLMPFPANDWGDIFSNGTGYGEVYSTYAKKTELAICCLYYNWYLHLLDGSQYIAKSTITAVVPGAKLLPATMTVIYPFSNKVWLAVFIMLAIMTGVHHLITSLNLKHNSNRETIQPPVEKSIFDMISIYLDQGIFPNSVSSSYRVLISFILLSGVVLSNSYSSGLASVLTVPRYGKSIETIHDFVETPFRWGSSSTAWVLSLFGADSLLFQHDVQMVVQKFDMEPDEGWLHRRSLQGDYGLGIEVLNGGGFAFLPYIQTDNVNSFDILKEEFYFTYTIGYSQRGWPLMEYFNKFDLEAIQYGFLIHWEKRMLRKYLSHRIQQALMEKAVGHNEGEEVTPLTVQHIVGSIIVLSIGWGAALTVFIGELCWNALRIMYERYTNQRNAVCKR